MYPRYSHKKKKEVYRKKYSSVFYHSHLHHYGQPHTSPLPFTVHNLSFFALRYLDICIHNIYNIYTHIGSLCKWNHVICISLWLPFFISSLRNFCMLVNTVKGSLIFSKYKIIGFITHFHTLAAECCTNRLR
jgi:hypothetical protein